MSGYGARRIRRRSRAGLLRITPGPARRRLEANSPAVQGMTIAYYARAGAPPPRGEFAGGPGHDYCVLRPPPPYCGPRWAIVPFMRVLPVLGLDADTSLPGIHRFRSSSNCRTSRFSRRFSSLTRSSFFSTSSVRLARALRLARQEACRSALVAMMILPQRVQQFGVTYQQWNSNTPWARPGLISTTKSRASRCVTEQTKKAAEAAPGPLLSTQPALNRIMAYSACG